MIVLKRPKLIKENNILGYDSIELGQYMKTIGKFQEWVIFFQGSTGMITKAGKWLVYKSDVDRFLGGLPNID